MKQKLIKEEIIWLKKNVIDRSQCRPRTSVEDDQDTPGWVYAPAQGAFALEEGYSAACDAYGKERTLYLMWRRWAYLINQWYKSELKLPKDIRVCTATLPGDFYGDTLEELAEQLVTRRSSSSRRVKPYEIIFVYLTQTDKLRNRATYDALMEWVKAGSHLHYSTSTTGFAVIPVGFELKKLEPIDCSNDCLIDSEEFFEFKPISVGG